MARTSRSYPCVGNIISSPNTRTLVRSSLRRAQVTRSLSLRVEPKAMQSITRDITGNVVAVPCEANFRNDRKFGTEETSSLMYLVRAACRARKMDGFVLNTRSTVQHESRSLASDKSTVARFRSLDACKTIAPDFDWSLKSMKWTPKCLRH
jgi:hypothetical protein